MWAVRDVARSRGRLSRSRCRRLYRRRRDRLTRGRGAHRRLQHAGIGRALRLVLRAGLRHGRRPRRRGERRAKPRRDFGRLRSRDDRTCRDMRIGRRRRADRRPHTGGRGFTSGRGLDGFFRLRLRPFLERGRLLLFRWRGSGQHITAAESDHERGDNGSHPGKKCKKRRSHSGSSRSPSEIKRASAAVVPGPRALVQSPLFAARSTRALPACRYTFSGGQSALADAR